MTNSYDVIIAGGGPVGVSLGIELGLQNIKTLILEKYKTPLLSPRAQSLTPRSMEFLMRWGINKKLRNKQLFPQDFKMQGVWCSGLNGKTYGCASSSQKHKEEISPEKGIRIPLWLTEETMRERLVDFDCITMLTENEVTNVRVNNEQCIVTARDHKSEQEIKYSSKYVAACDGANSKVREQCQIEFEQLAPSRHILNLLFKAPALVAEITVEEGFLYYMLKSRYPGAMGIVDPTQGIWYAQIFFDDFNTAVDDVDIADVLLGLTNMEFDFEVLNAHFWKMQIELAKHFSYANRILLVGDSAHAFAPTGGFGLNTGLGDVVNLGWKLAEIIKHNAPVSLLNTYEEERRQIAQRNLLVAEKNARDAVNLRKQHDPVKDPEGFVKANQELAKQHVGSNGLMMGYTYVGESQQLEIYTPTIQPGYFLPHKDIDGESIYNLLPPNKWTLIIPDELTIGDMDSLGAKFNITPGMIYILNVPTGIYRNVLLIRPDWHIASIF